MPGSPGSSEGADGMTLSSVGDPGTSSQRRVFFFFLCLRGLTFPSWTFCSFCGSPSGPEAHPGLEPGSPGSTGPSVGPDGKALSSVGDPGPASLRRGRVLLFFFCPWCLTSTPTNFNFPSWAFCPSWGTPSGPRRTLGANQGCQGPWGPAQGLIGRHFCPWMTQTPLRGAFFFFFSLPQVPHLPLMGLLPALGSPLRPKTHPGLKPGTPGSTGPSAGHDAKAISSAGDPGPASPRRAFFFLCPSCLTFPSWAFCPPWGTPIRPEAQPVLEPVLPGSTGPSAGADGKAFSCVGDPGPTFSMALFFFFLPQVPHLSSLKLHLPLMGLLSALRCPYRPEAHPGVEPGTPGSTGPSEGADGKALSSVGDPGPTSLHARFFLFFFSLCPRCLTRYLGG
nr:collagen alpha-4(IV) chain-like [Pongo abelii]